MRIHFGLAAASAVDAVEVRWPNGAKERFEHLAADKIHVLKEGAGKSVAPAAAAR
jgi:enediyne biosynthesis protein E4